MAETAWIINVTVTSWDACSLKTSCAHGQHFFMLTSLHLGNKVAKLPSFRSPLEQSSSEIAGSFLSQEQCSDSSQFFCFNLLQNSLSSASPMALSVWRMPSANCSGCYWDWRGSYSPPSLSFLISLIHLLASMLHNLDLMFCLFEIIK